MKRKWPAWTGDAFTAVSAVVIGAVGAWHVGWAWALGLLLTGIALGMTISRRQLASLRRPRYQAVIVGRESGIRTPLDFITFHALNEAMQWVVAMNDKHQSRQTFYDWEKIPR